jgi:hypothetical protein
MLNVLQIIVLAADLTNQIALGEHESSRYRDN